MALTKKDFNFLAGVMRNVKEERLSYNSAVNELSHWCSLHNENFKPDLFKIECGL